MKHTFLDIRKIRNIRLYYKRFIHHRYIFSKCKYTKNIGIRDKYMQLSVEVIVDFFAVIGREGRGYRTKLIVGRL